MTESKGKIAHRGDLVRIHLVVLEPGARAENLPEVTRRVPYEAWLKGYLLQDQGELGAVVQIETFIGRRVEGTLVEIDPRYDHDFGASQPELWPIGPEAWRRLQAGGGRG